MTQWDVYEYIKNRGRTWTTQKDVQRDLNMSQNRASSLLRRMMIARHDIERSTRKELFTISGARVKKDILTYRIKEAKWHNAKQ